ncbi:hypothetical protein AB0M43_38265 [Longispora sp. NPDC051575]|uniref:hypothetical protein n=1 Tax=Longispora sp. NPDC051575 TaxID=3154943 RepID=UPI00342AAAA0
MGWFWKRRKPDPAAEDPAAEDQAVAELLDPYHGRASISGGGQVVVNASQVMENIALAMERLDLDINTPVSIAEDVVPVDVLASMVQQMQMGPAIALHVVNTSARIMTRYPKELAGLPLPEGYDIREMHPLKISDAHHELARRIFNRRTASRKDLGWDDVPEVERLDVEGQLQVFLCLFFMFASKVGAIQWRMANPHA